MFKKKEKNLITMPSGTKIYKEEKFPAFTQYEHYVTDKFNEKIHPLEEMKQALYDYDDLIYKEDRKFSPEECFNYILKSMDIIDFDTWLKTEFLEQKEFYMTPEWDKKREERKEIVQELQDRLVSENEE